MASGDSKAGGFTVTDRRSFAGASARPRTVAAPPPPAARRRAPRRPGRRPPACRPSTSTRSCCRSGSSALLHLGELEHPDVGATAEGPAAGQAHHRHPGDAGEKTRGNLTPAEEKLIESLLYDLRLRYVEARTGQVSQRVRVREVAGLQESAIRTLQGRETARPRRSSRCAPTSSRTPATGKNTASRCGFGITATCPSGEQRARHDQRQPHRGAE